MAYDSEPLAFLCGVWESIVGDVAAHGRLWRFLGARPVFGDCPDGNGYHLPAIHGRLIALTVEAGSCWMPCAWNRGGRRTDCPVGVAQLSGGRHSGAQIPRCLIRARRDSIFPRRRTCTVGPACLLTTLETLWETHGCAAGGSTADAEPRRFSDRSRGHCVSPARLYRGTSSSKHTFR